MNRWWLSVGIILGGAVGLASAEYLVLIANVGQMHANEKSGPPRQGGPVTGPPMPPPGMGPMGGPMGGTKDDLTPAEMEEIEEKILVAILPLEASFTVTQRAKLQSKADVVAVTYQGKFHARILALEFVTEHPSETRVGAVLHRQDVDARNTVGKPLEIPNQRFLTRRTHLLGSGKPTAAALTELAEYALGLGLIKDVGIVMEDLEKVNKEDPTLKAYRAVEEAFARGPLPDDPLAGQRSSLTQKRKSIVSPHFTLWYTGATTPDLQSRLDRLEDTLHIYYLWWALKLSPLPLPSHRLTVFVDADESEFNQLHGMLTYRRDPATFKGDPHLETALTSAPIVSGGYYCRRENLTVVSFKRIDPKYDLLNAHCATTWEKLGQPEKLLSSRWDPPTEKLPAKSEAQSFALMARLMEDDAERASISHNVSRQALVASGLLPRNLAAPEWVEFGLGSFFETPLNAPWASPTASSSLYQPLFRELEGNRTKQSPYEKLEATTAETLKKVVRDGYFREVPADKADVPASVARARATSWALMYFLVKEERVKLRAYLADLSRLPRDMELPDEVLERCFYRRFGLWDESKQAVNEAELQTLARRWTEYIHQIKPEYEELLGTVKKARETMVKASVPARLATPGQPGQPGNGPRPNIP